MGTNTRPFAIFGIFLSIIAWGLFFTGSELPPDGWIGSMAKFFTGIAFIFAFGALVFIAEHIIPLIVTFIDTTRSAWYRPANDQARVYASMTPAQMKLYERRGIVKVKGSYNRADNRFYFDLVTPSLDVPFDWINGFLEQCEITFPEIPSQHGLPDNVERSNRKAFTRYVCNPSWEIAEWGRGSSSSKWLLPNMAMVYQLFGWDDELYYQRMEEENRPEPEQPADNGRADAGEEIPRSERLGNPFSS